MKKVVQKNKITKKIILKNLKNVMDPELGINIVDLGLIYKVKVIKQNFPSPKYKVELTMTLTSPGCPLADMFESLIQHGLKKIKNFDPKKDLIINLVFDPPWTKDMMDPKIQAQMGLD